MSFLTVFILASIYEQTMNETFFAVTLYTIHGLSDIFLYTFTRFSKAVRPLCITLHPFSGKQLFQPCQKLRKPALYLFFGYIQLPQLIVQLLCLLLQIIRIQIQISDFLHYIVDLCLILITQGNVQLLCRIIDSLVNTILIRDPLSYDRILYRSDQCLRIRAADIFSDLTGCYQLVCRSFQSFCLNRLFRRARYMPLQRRSVQLCPTGQTVRQRPL